MSLVSALEDEEVCVACGVMGEVVVVFRGGGDGLPILDGWVGWWFGGLGDLVLGFGWLLDGLWF